MQHIRVCEAVLDEIIREREQLRILKNFIKNDKVITKNEILTLLEAMEVNNE